MHYFLFRYGTKADGGYGYRCEKARTVQEACKLAFGVIYSAPYSGNVVYKDMGTRSPRYMSGKVKQQFYSDDGWQTIN